MIEISNIQVQRDCRKRGKSITEILNEILEDICNNYCKYPEQWDEEKEGCELCESDICMNCPLNRI